MGRVANVIRTLGMLAVLFGGAAALRANDTELAALKEQFRSRLPRLMELKRDGKLGETSQGFVEAVRPEFLGEGAVKRVRDDENADRRRAYAILGAQEGVDAKRVAERNARRTFSRAQRGEYLRHEDGVWRRKR